MDHWLHGMFTALVTPFIGDAIDEGAFAALVAWQAREGADGVVVGSATGEHSTLSLAERARLVTVARLAAGPSYPVIAAAGTNGTDASVAEVERATAAGASAILLRMPYYNRPSQAGLLAHVHVVTAATWLPVIIDNDPDRCGVDVLPETLAQIARASNVVGVLERRGDISRCDRIARACSRQFMRLTGAADAVPAYMLAGGCGAVTSLGNVAPRLLARMKQVWRSGAFDQAQIFQRRLLPLHALLASEPDPVAVKLALSLLQPGFDPQCRLPLVPAAETLHEALRNAIDDLPRPLAHSATPAVSSAAA